MTPNRSRLALIFAALLVAALIPVWMVAVPPLPDYPNHLARMHILIHASDSEALRQFYEVRWAVIPNLAMDLIVPPLTYFFPLEVAGKIFISLTLTVIATGTMALHYALHRRLSYWPLTVFLVLYNGSFLWGFLNFLFGIGFALWLLAAWIYLRDRLSWKVALLFSCLAVPLFFAHLVGLATYGIGVAAYELARGLKERAKLSPALLKPWCMVFAQFVIPALLLFLFSPTSDTPLVSTHEYNDSRFYAVRKLGGLLQFLHNYDQTLDLVTLILVAQLIILGIISRRISIDPMLRFALAILAVAYLAMPFQAFGSNYADYRLTVPLALLFIASADLRPLTSRQSAVIATALLCLFIGRTAFIGHRWLKSDAFYAQVYRSIAAMKEGSRLFVAYAPGALPTNYLVADFPSFAVIKKSAFVPTIFAVPGAQPVALRPTYEAIAKQTPTAPFSDQSVLDWDWIARRYDYVLVLEQQELGTQLPADLQLVRADRNMSLYRPTRAPGSP